MPAFFTESDFSVDTFAEICSQTTTLTDYPNAEAIASNVLVYNGKHLAKADAITIKSEFAHCLNVGPGVFAIRGTYTDLSVIDRTTELFFTIIAEEQTLGGGKGDHFGTNERVWNSKQKTCVRDPELFIDYYSNPLLALACQAWLGPHYQVTAQVNNVKPRGDAQSPHRDYHLGFQSPAMTAQFPAHAQVMSQYLTLQGAIAHGDMPLTSGPTLFLPFSQQFAPGYLTYQRPEFAAYFAQHKVQVPFEKGDMVFFNPALFHGAGTNLGDTDRLANLLQISSAFGRTMESLDTHGMIAAVYPALQTRLATGTLTNQLLENTIAAVADGYAFPTNLDSDPPLGGNAPETDQQIMRQALTNDWPYERLQAALQERAQRRTAF